MASTEGGRIETANAASGWGMRAVPPSQPTWGLGERRKLSSGSGWNPGWKCIWAYFEGYRTLFCTCNADALSSLKFFLLPLGDMAEVSGAITRALT